MFQKWRVIQEMKYRSEYYMTQRADAISQINQQHF